MPLGLELICLYSGEGHGSIPDDMEVRIAQAADYAGILSLWNTAIRETDATFESVEKSLGGLTELIETRRESGHETFVGVHEGSIVGFSTYSQFRGGTGYVYTMEHTVNVARSARGKGLARALMRAVEDHAASNGARSIIAGVSSANPDGVPFHVRLGYVEVARIPGVGRKWGRWLDLILMQKDLSPDASRL